MSTRLLLAVLLALSVPGTSVAESRHANAGLNGPGHDTQPLSVTQSSRRGGAADPAVGYNPDFATATLISAIPAAFSSVASLTLGATDVARNHPIWPIVGALSGAVTLGSSIAYAASNKNRYSLSAPYLAVGMITGLPAIGFSTYGWLARASQPIATVQVLALGEITLTPPAPTVMSTPTGKMGIGAALLNGVF